MDSRRLHTPAAALFGIACLLAASSAPAQSTDGPDVTLHAAPSTVTVGGPVHIFGTGYPQPGVPVTLTIRAPGASSAQGSGGQPVTLRLTPDANGNYSTLFMMTAVAGTYDVSAGMGTKGPPARTQFAVRPLGALPQEAGQKEKELTTDLARLVTALRTNVANLPDSPARQQLLDRIGRLDAQMQQLPAQADKLQTALRQLASVQSQGGTGGTSNSGNGNGGGGNRGSGNGGGNNNGGNGGSDGAGGGCSDGGGRNLDAWLSCEPEQDQRIRQEIGRSQSRLATCDGIDQTIEALKAVSAGLNFANSAVNIVLAFATDLAAAKAPDALPGSLGSNSNAAFATGQAVGMAKTVASGLSGPLSVLGVAMSLVTSAITQAEQNTFDRYCEKFQGPFTAQMEAKFYAKDHGDAPWWTYTIDIAGTLTLRYPKGAAGQSIPLSGQFEGGATRLTYHEEVWKNSDLFKLITHGIVIKRDQTPAVIPRLDYEGSAFGTYSTPTSFYIPVTGQFSNGRITFKMQSARSDFQPDYTVGHTFYVVMAGVTMGMPVLGHFTLPYKDAHWVLDHYTFDYPVTKLPDQMLFQKHDEELRPTIGTWAHYILDLKACNPACN